MKSRRFVLVAFMLVATLVIGVGFAVYSTTLAIHGATEVSQGAIDFVESVVFTNAESDNESFGTAAIATDGQTASFSVVGMTQKNESVHFTYTIENQSDYDIDVEISTYPTSVKITDFTVTTILGSNTVVKGGSVTVDVTVVLNEDVAVVVAPVGWTIEYTAVSREP